MIATQKNRFQQAVVFLVLHLHKLRSENEPIEALESQIEMLDHTFGLRKNTLFFALPTYIDINEFHMKHVGPARDTGSQWISWRFKNGILDRRNLMR